MNCPHCREYLELKIENIIVRASDTNRYEELPILICDNCQTFICPYYPILTQTVEYISKITNDSLKMLYRVKKEPIDPNFDFL
jgi:hypothetical protein